MSHITEEELEKLRKDLASFPKGTDNLSIQLESVLKHILTYLKIVKGHIGQLSSVLQLESHNHRTLETANLAQPVLQLIKIFDKLEDSDIQRIEELSIIAKNWQSSYTSETKDAPVVATTASEI